MLLLAEDGTKLVMLAVDFVVDFVLAAAKHQVRVRLSIGISRIEIIALVSGKHAA